jgi:ATP-dependent helicase Lhr and Lhr-like helicase
VADATERPPISYFENAEQVERFARLLLKRYGVVFRRLITRESGAPAWRELLTVYRRLEARGEIRGGRFLQGPSGEQFALPEAVGLMRAVRKETNTGSIITISGTDPLNLVGIVTPEERRVAAVARNRILYRDGIPIASIEGGELHRLTPGVELDDLELKRAATRSRTATSEPAVPVAIPVRRPRHVAARLGPAVVEPVL